MEFSDGEERFIDQILFEKPFFIYEYYVYIVIELPEKYYNKIPESLCHYQEGQMYMLGNSEETKFLENLLEIKFNRDTDYYRIDLVDKLFEFEPGEKNTIPNLRR